MGKETKRWIYLLLILPPLFWAGNTVLARGIADQILPRSMSFWRWFIALTILFPFTRKQILNDWEKICASWKILFLIGLLGISSFNTLLYSAAHTTTALNIALIQAIMPAVIMLLSYLLFGELISRIQLLAVILCIFGAGYIVMRGDWHRLQQLSFVQGDLLMLLAIVFYALYSVLLRKRPKIHPLSLLTVTFAVGVVTLFPLYLWEMWNSPPLQLTQSVVLGLLYVGFFPSIFAYFCWNRGIELVGANRAGLYINLIPFFASIMAIIFLGETLQSYHIWGLCLIVAGLILSNWPGRKKYVI